MFFSEPILGPHSSYVMLNFELLRKKVTFETPSKSGGGQSGTPNPQVAPTEQTLCPLPLGVLLEPTGFQEVRTRRPKSHLGTLQAADLMIVGRSLASFLVFRKTVRHQT